MRFELPEPLRGEIDLWDLLEVGLFVLFYWMLPHLRRRHKGKEELLEEPVPDEDPWSEPTVSLEPVTTVSADGPVRDLQEAMERWKETASPVVGDQAASHLVGLVWSQLPQLDTDGPWNQEDIGAAGAIARSLEELVARSSHRTDPAARLLLDCALELLRRPALSGGLPVVLFPVDGPLSGLAEQLLDASGIVALRLPVEEASATQRFMALEDAVLDHMSRQDARVEVMVQRAVQELAVEAGRDPAVNRIARVMLMEDEAGEAVFRGVCRTLLMAETGPLVPLHLAPDHAFGWLWNGDLPSAVTLYLGQALPGSPPVDGLEGASHLPWDSVGAAVSRGAGVERGAARAGSWDSDDLERYERVSQWLLRGAVGDPGESSLDSVEALVAWRIAERDGAVLHGEEITRLRALVDGTLPREVAVELRDDEPVVGRHPAVSASRGRRDLIDAVTLHILLGAPRSRRHPVFRGGPLPVWRRSVP